LVGAPGENIRWGNRGIFGIKTKQVKSVKLTCQFICCIRASAFGLDVEAGETINEY
jgi:hypothetical protein